MPNDFVPKQLEEKAALYRQRNSQYGDSYKRIGRVLAAYFGEEGVVLKTPKDFGRFVHFMQIAGRVGRYATQFAKGGHVDSMDDIAVYAMILKELDEEEPVKKEKVFVGQRFA
jgi:2-iminoacetate synthase ThiH